MFHSTVYVLKLYVLGGLVGLFTGMSLLSLFEILFWCGRIASAGLKPITRSFSTQTK